MRSRLVFFVAFFALVLGGCGDMVGTPGSSTEPGPTPSTAGRDGTGVGAPSDGTGGYAGSDPSGSAGSSSSSGGTADAGVSTDPPSPAGGCLDTACAGPETIPAGQLTAGACRDLDDWSFWLGLFDSDLYAGMHEYWGYDTTSRIPVRVTSGGVPVIDARVSLIDADGAVAWEAHSDSRGRAELFASLFEPQTGPFTVRVKADGVTREVADVSPAWMTPIAVEMPAPSAPPASLDLMFMIDTTGSMGDEIEYIKSELGDVIARSQAEATQDFDLRVSMNFYKDIGDTYVVDPHPFTTHVSDVVTQLAAEHASGGGDFPEAVDQAVASAIDDHAWRENATARLLFLVLDAPPHHDADVMERLRAANRAAAARGVKIIPVVASGIDKQTEFAMRFLALTTNGTYTFLTNNSGIGGDHLAPSIGRYKVWFLNDLLVHIITEEVAPTEG